MMWWNHGAWDAGDWAAMSFMMLASWGLVAVLVVWLVRNRNGRDDTSKQGTPSVTPRADEVLDGRFARGEIDADEYERRRALLHDSASRA